jgi:hypothetical protein
VPAATGDPFILLVQSAVVPVVFLIIGVLARRLGRRDGDDSPRPNDWAAGTSVILMGLGKAMSDLLDIYVRKRGDPANVALWIIGLLLAAFISIDRDRYASWVVKEGKPSRDRRLWGGIVFPNAVALLIFTAYRYMKLKK